MSEYSSWCATQAKPWCDSVMQAKRHADSLRETVDALREQYDGLKSVRYDREGGHVKTANGDDVVVELICVMENAIASFTEAQHEWVFVMEELSMCCEQLEGRYAQLIRLRYCCNYDWDTVSDKIGYDCSYARGQLHTEALAALYHVMPHKYRDPFYLACN